MSSFSDSLEVVLGAELYRPKPQYISRYAVQPQIIHDFQATPGAVVRMKRFGFWNDPGSYTLTARTRDKSQTIGTGGGRGLPAEEVLITLQEFTGPSSGNAKNPGEAGVLKISMMDLIQQQRMLYNVQQAAQFHQSIGSETLFEDYRRWKDSIYIGLLLGTNPATSTGGQIATTSQGGYYNPAGVANGGTYNIGTGVPKLDIVRDLTKVVSDMRTRLVPPFNSNLGDVYHALATPGFMRALRQDKEFRTVAQYPGIPINMLPMSNSPTLPGMPPIMNWNLNPNELVRSGGFYGQTGFMHSMVMPTGIVFEGIRFFECTNIPTIPVSLTTTGLSTQGYSDGSATRNAESAIVFGQNVIGEGIWDNGPRVKLNTNTDYDRFLMAIWQEYSGYTILNSSNVTVMRTFDTF
jgi:hypothetical protein